MNNIYEKFVVDNIGEYVFIVDVDKKQLVYINDSLKKYMNISDCCQIEYIDFLNSIDIPCSLEKIDTLTLDVFNKRYWHNHNKDMHYIIKTKLTKHNDRLVLVQSYFDITQEFSDVKKLEEKLEINKSIIECANTLLKDASSSTNIVNLLEIICNFYQGTRVNLFLFDIENETIHCKYFYCHDDNIVIKDKVNSAEISSKIWRELIKDNNYYCDNLDDVFDANSIEYIMMSKINVKSFTASAIQRNNENIGFIIIDNPKSHRKNFDVLDTATVFIANNMDCIFFENELEKSALDTAIKKDISRFILQCAQILFENKDISQSITQLLTTICGYYNASRCSLLEYVYNDDGVIDNHNDDFVELTLTYEYSDDNVPTLLTEFKDKILNQDKSTFDKLQNHKCVYTKIDQLDLTLDSFEYKVLQKNGVDSLMILPLRTNDKLVGLVLLQNPSLSKSNPLDIDILYTVSGFLITELNKRNIVNELEKLSFSDQLTGLYNRNYYLRTIEILQLSPPEKLGVIFADINGLKRVNDNLGHEYGDAFIRWCANFLNKHNKNYPVFRIGGDEFICVVYDMNAEEFFEHIKIMRDELYEANLVNMSMGGTFVEGDVNINQQIVETDKIMYYEKQKYYILKKLMNVNVESELLTLENLLKEHIE